MYTFETYIGDDVEVMVEITNYSSVGGSFSYNAASDLDYYGYSDAEWGLLDMNEKPVSDEIMALVTKEDEERIYNMICEYMEKRAEDEAAIDRYEASRDRDYYY